MSSTPRFDVGEGEWLIGAVVVPAPVGDGPRPVPAPLPTLPTRRLPGGCEVLLDIAQMDRSGRVSARGVLRTLGWRAHRVDVDVLDGVLVVASAAFGRHVVGGVLALPAALRRLCGIAGPTVVLAGYPPAGLVVIHPVGTVVGLLNEFHARLAGAGRAADQAQIATARQMLARLGVTVVDLQRAERPAVPTMAEFLPRVMAAAGPGARRTYGSYWQRMAVVCGAAGGWMPSRQGHRGAAAGHGASARRRRTSRGGRHAGEHVIAAARAVFTRAIADGLLDASASPAHRVRHLCCAVQQRWQPGR